MTAGTIVGLFLGFAQISLLLPVRKGAWLTTHFFRNAPWLVLLFYCMFLLPFQITVFGVTIPLPAELGGTLETFPLADISCGGIAILDNKLVLGNTIGHDYKNCRIDLPDIGTVTATLQVRNDHPGDRSLFGIPLSSRAETYSAGLTAAPVKELHLLGRLTYSKALYSGADSPSDRSFLSFLAGGLYESKHWRLEGNYTRSGVDLVPLSTIYAGNRVALQPRPLALYRWGSESLSAAPARMDMHAEAVLRRAAARGACQA